MQFSRSLMAAVVMGSLLTAPAKALDVDYKLVGACALGALATFLHKRTVDATKKDAFSTVLNAGSSVTQKSVNFVKDNFVSGAVGLAAAFTAYHNKNLLNTHIAHTVFHYAKAAAQRPA